MGVTTDPDATGVPSFDHGHTMPAAGDRDGICASQTRASAGALTLNGAAVSGGAYQVSHPGCMRVTLYSAGNLAAKTFTLTGLDRDGVVQTEDLAGPNAGSVVSTKFYSRITGISVGATMGGVNIEVGFDFPLIVLPATARGRIVNIINPITVLKALAATYPVIAVDIPLALWVTARSFIQDSVMTFTAGSNKTPSIALGSTTIKGFGTANGADTNPLRFKTEIIRAGASAQRNRWDFLWGGLVENDGVTPSAEDDSGAYLRFSFFCNSVADAEAVLESFSFDVVNTP